MEMKFIVNRRDENKVERLYGLATNPFSARARAETDIQDMKNGALRQLDIGAGSDNAMAILLGKVGLSEEVVSIVCKHCTVGKVWEVIVRDSPKYEVWIGEVAEKEANSEGEKES